MKNELSVQTSLMPFSIHSDTISLPYGYSIKEIVSNIVPRRIQGLDIIITLNGEAVPEEYWSWVRPKIDTLVGLNVIPTGGGGKKNPLASIISIGLLIAAPYIAGALAPGLAAGLSGVYGPITAGQLAFANGAIRVGLGLVGFLARTALSSTPKQSSGNRDDTIRSSPTQFIDGATNAILRYGVVPICLGRNRMFPPQAALPYAETIGNSQYIRQLFTWGCGSVIVENLQIGETDISAFTGVQIESRLAGNLHTGTNLYSKDVYEENFSNVLTLGGGFVTKTTQLDADEAIVDLTLPQGLVIFNEETGAKELNTLILEVQFSPTGAGTWSTGITSKYFTSQVVTVPAVIEGGLGIPNANGYGVIALNLATGERKAFTTYSIKQSVIIPDGWVRIASYDATVASGVTTLRDDRASIVGQYIPNLSSFIPASFTSTTITIGDGFVASNPYVYKNAFSETIRLSYRIQFPSRGQYDVRIRKVTPDPILDRVRDKTVFTAMRTITNRNPVNLQGISGTAVRILATDQLNGSLDRFNAEVTSIGLDYNVGTGTWVTRAINNPASIYRYVLQHPAFLKRLPDASIRISELENWHNYCRIKGLTYNKIIDTETNIEDVLRDVAAAGMATPNSVYGTYGVIIDDEKPDIKGMVTPRNSSNYSGNIVYPELPHALRVEFRNAAKGYNLDEVIVYADGYNAGNAAIFERLEFPSCTNANLAWFYGRRYLATAILQPETHKFTMDFENRTFSRGDRIVFVNDSILVGIGSPRIKAIIDNGVNVTGFTVDDRLDIPSISGFGVRVRQADASGFPYFPLSVPARNQAAYWLFGSQAYFQLSGSNTTFLNRLHRTDTPQSFWVACHFKYITSVSGINPVIFATTNGTTQGVAVRLTGSTKRVQLSQRNNTALVDSSDASLPLLVDGTDYVLIGSVPAGGGTITWWINGVVYTEALTYGTATSDPILPMRIANSHTLDTLFQEDSRMYSFAMGNNTLSNAQAAAIRSQYLGRRQVDFEYTPLKTLISSTVMDLDAGLGISADTGQVWRNINTAPADGSPQSAYNFNLGDSPAPSSNDPNYIAEVNGTSQFNLVTPVLIANAPQVGSLCTFTEVGKELDLIVKEIRGSPDDTVEITAINYAPERFNATTGAIPDFDSNITIAPELVRPNPPRLASDVVSDESVMSRNPDGSYTGRMVINLIDTNRLPVTSAVKIRRSASTEFVDADLLSSSPDRVVITGLQDGALYDVHIRYQGQLEPRLISAPLQLNSLKYVGASSRPANVQNFNLSVVSGVGLLNWTANAEIDISHYQIRFNSLTVSATWDNSQVLVDRVMANNLSTPVQKGTYFIKAVDILGNVSVAATTIISENAGLFTNVVNTLTENPTFAGTKTNVTVSSGDLILTSTASDGIYKFNTTTDLGSVYECFLSASVIAYGQLVAGAVSTVESIRAIPSIRSLPSVRGINPSDWEVYLEVRTTNDNITWTAWSRFANGNYIFRGVEFRLIMKSYNSDVTPRVDILSARIDMPDRLEKGYNLSCPPAGITVTYPAAFKEIPSLNITIQNGSETDRLEIISQSVSAFNIKVYNTTAAAYVTRAFNYASIGYGRVI